MLLMLGVKSTNKNLIINLMIKFKHYKGVP
jgi:hypothetical protein